MDIARGCAEFKRDRIQLVGGVRQLRQRLRQLAAVDPGALPEVGIGARGKISRRWLGDGRDTLVGRDSLVEIKHWIAESDHRLAALILARKRAQRLQAR